MSDLEFSVSYKSVEYVSKFADTVFETKGLKSRRNVCLFLQITSDCTGTEYCKTIAIFSRQLILYGILHL